MSITSELFGDLVFPMTRKEVSTIASQVDGHSYFSVFREGYNLIIELGGDGNFYSRSVLYNGRIVDYL
jgi:hypothetical protein